MGRGQGTHREGPGQDPRRSVVGEEWTAHEVVEDIGHSAQQSPSEGRTVESYIGTPIPRGQRDRGHPGQRQAQREHLPPLWRFTPAQPPAQCHPEWRRIEQDRGEIHPTRPDSAQVGEVHDRDSTNPEADSPSAILGPPRSGLGHPGMQGEPQSPAGRPPERNGRGGHRFRHGLATCDADEPPLHGHQRHESDTGPMLAHGIHGVQAEAIQNGTSRTRAESIPTMSRSQMSSGAPRP